MSIQLTAQQQKALDAEKEIPPRITDPRTNTDYVLVRATEYESIREILDDERRQKAIHNVALRRAAGRMNDTP